MNLADEIWCINLYQRNDRFQQAKEQLKKMRLDQVTKFHRVNKDPEGGKAGCYRSHISLLKRLRENNLNRICIFEDDIIKSDEWSESSLRKCIKFMNENQDWLILFLGCNPSVWFSKIPKTKHSNIYKVRALTTHGYIASKRLLPHLTEDYRNTPIDEVYFNLPQTYAYLPGLVHQSNSPSDIISLSTNNQILRKLRYPYLRYKGLYIHHINLPVLFWILVIIFIIVVYYIRKSN